MKRVYNFNAGPSAMPLEVLEEVQQEFLDFKGTGMSVVEISHRSKAYQEMQDETIALMKKLLNIGSISGTDMASGALFALELNLEQQCGGNDDKKS